jgi:hypothetical protein
LNKIYIKNPRRTQGLIISPGFSNNSFKTQVQRQARPENKLVSNGQKSGKKFEKVLIMLEPDLFPFFQIQNYLRCINPVETNDANFEYYAILLRILVKVFLLMPR